MKPPRQRTRWAIAAVVSGLTVAGGPVAVAAAITPDSPPATVRVAAGEALSTIAARYHTTVAGLVAANRIGNPNLVVAGQLLRLPGPGSAGTGPPATVRVAAGEALSTIAARYHTTVAGLVAANRIGNPNLVVAGQLLRLPGPGSAGTGPPATVRVAAGEALSTIAARYHTTVAGLVAANRIGNPNVVDAGQLLYIPGAGWAGAAGTASPIGSLPSYLLAHPDRLVLQPDFVKAAVANGVPVSLLESVCWWESGWQVGVVSSTGAVGVCQIEPSTAAYLNSVVIPGRQLSAHSPVDNITMAAAYLHQLLLGAGGNESLAIGAYYQGLASVKQQGLLPETRTYVNGIRTYIPIFGGAG